MKASLRILFTASCLFLVSQAESAIFGSDCGNNKTHNFYFGAKAPYQSLLYTKHVLAEGKFLRKTSVDVSFPPNGTLPLGQIRYIEALDQATDGTGGCVFVRSGGVGADRVTLHLKSQRNHGLDVYIFVYGKRNIWT